MAKCSRPSHTTPHEHETWEVEAEAAHQALQVQKQPPLGEQPGLLKESAPHRSDRTAAHSSGDAPSLVPPSLADAAAMLWTTPRWASLPKVALKQKRKEEEARRVEKEQMKAAKGEWEHSRGF